MGVLIYGVSSQAGIEEGISRGMERGIKQGVEQGFERGKIETARENAKKFLKMGISAEKIAEGTGLPFKTVLSLKNE